MNIQEIEKVIIHIANQTTHDRDCTGYILQAETPHRARLIYDGLRRNCAGNILYFKGENKVII